VIDNTSWFSIAGNGGVASPFGEETALFFGNLIIMSENKDVSLFFFIMLSTTQLSYPGLYQKDALLPRQTSQKACPDSIHYGWFMPGAKL
jgi:hypothetical protein